MERATVTRGIKVLRVKFVRVILTATCTAIALMELVFVSPRITASSVSSSVATTTATTMENVTKSTEYVLAIMVGQGNIAVRHIAPMDAALVSVLSARMILAECANVPRGMRATTALLVFVTKTAVVMGSAKIPKYRRK